ncbi:tripartite tricarboxylate transporter substrate binding protein [Fusobacterium sp. PH5-44]|uniref:tripartite tricarboxylate transporter substrate binding protein n=1 Tax=unclassified Fusobacterium TaxID=2648384 RepID=UPI003D2120D7
MKKLLTFFTAVMFILVSCGKSDTKESTTTSNNTQATQTSEIRDWGNGFPAGQPITFMVPGKSGGGSDLAIRHLANFMQKDLGITTVVTNFDSNTIGHQTLANAKNDGTNITLATAALNIQYITGVVNLNPTKDLELIAALQDNGFSALAAPVNAPYNNFAEFVAYAKANPNMVNAGQPNSGNNQFQFGLIQKEMGIKLNAVECSSESDRLTNLAGGFIDIGFVGVKNALEYEKAGKIKVIGTLADNGKVIANMDPNLPDNFKTLQEQGFKDMYWSVHHYIYGPKGMNKEQIKAINATFKNIIESTQVKDGISALGQIPEWYNVEDSYTVRNNEYNRLVGIAKDLGILVNE